MMLTSRALAIAHLHRSRIDAHILRAVDLTAMNPEAARQRLASARWRLLQMLREYHLFKQIEIFEPAFRSGSPRQARQAEQMSSKCKHGWSGFRAYTAEWSSCDVVGSWQSYREAMSAMASQLRKHVADEEMLLADLLRGSTRTRQLIDMDTDRLGQFRA